MVAFFDTPCTVCWSGMRNSQVRRHQRIINEFNASREQPRPEMTPVVIRGMQRRAAARVELNGRHVEWQGPYLKHSFTQLLLNK